MIKMKNLGLAIALTAGTVIAPLSLAATSAGTVITNSVTLNYQSANDAVVRTESSAISVTVTAQKFASLDPQDPADIYDDPNAQTGGTGSSALTLSNQGNGSDVYTLNATATTLTPADFDTQPAVSFHVDGNANQTSVQLFGANVMTDAVESPAGTFTFTVSNIDFISAIEANDVLNIGTNQYSVVSATQVGDATIPDQIVVTGPAGSTDIATGAQVGEQKEITFEGSLGSLKSTVFTSTVTYQLSISDSDGTVLTPSLADFNYTLNAAQISLSTLVSNLTSLIGPAASGITGEPTDVLEYEITISNVSNIDSDVVDIIVEIPDFTTVTSEPIKAGGTSTSTINATGTGSARNVEVVGGLAAGDSLVVTYTVTID